ncbi:MAG: TolC family protein [Deltaproteobacteria bacterium]
MKNKLLIILTFCSSICYSQSLLTLDEALKLALSNSFDLKFAQIQLNIAKANNTKGNAGMKPEINLFGVNNLDAGFLYQNFSEGDNKTFPLLASNTLNAGAELNWKVYDGGRMKLEKSRLGELESLSRIKYEDILNLTILNVTSAFYDVIRQKQQLRSIEEIINFNRERVKIAKAGLIAGTLPKTEVMQSQIDLNVSLENSINQKYVISNSKKNLNNTIGRLDNPDFEVLDTIIMEISDLKSEDLIKKIDSNKEIQMLKNEVKIAEIALEQANRLNKPVLSVNGNLGFTQVNNSGGSVLSTTSFGPGAGGRISYPLYTAGENKRKQTLAKLELENAKTNLDEAKMLIMNSIRSAYESYENQVELLKIEKSNNELARENLMISFERLRLGQTNSLEVHQAQEYLIQSNTRLINFQYFMKIAETKLKQLLSEF